MKNGTRALPAAIQAELVQLYAAGKWARLAVVAHRVTARYPRHLLGWQASGKALLQLRRLPDAIDRLTQVVKLAPEQADGYNDLGSALLDNGRVTEALANYRRAVALNPRSSEAYSNLGRVLRDLGQYQDAASCCRQAIDIDPDSAIAHNNLGNALCDLGRLSDAEACYHRALALRPDYLEALINSGSILADLGRWDEAKLTYQRAIQLHPGSGIPYNALGRLLSRLTEEDEQAEACLRQAIALNAYDTNTYVELGNILMRKRQTDAALAMFRHAQKWQPLITWRANQEKAEFSVLFLDTPMGGSTPVNYLAGRASYDRHFHSVLPETLADIDLLRGKADVVFNMICNPDDGADSLARALELVEHIGCPTVNHPRQIMNTNRESMARRLAGIPGCVVPRTIKIAGPALVTAVSGNALVEFSPPILARIAGTHGGDDFEKFDDWTGVADFVGKIPDANYYLIEFVDYGSADGFFRKYRVIFIDGEILPYHLAIHDHWKVHHFRTDMADHGWMRKEEEHFLQDMASVFNAEHQEALRAMAAATGLDYGGLDCGLDRDGRIVVFEANAAMLVHDEKTETFAYKNQYIAKIKNAFDAMLSRRRLPA